MAFGALNLPAETVERDYQYVKVSVPHGLRPCGTFGKKWGQTLLA